MAWRETLAPGTSARLAGICESRARRIRASGARLAPLRFRGDDVITFGRTQTPMSIPSRVISRGGGARGAIRTAGSRVIAAFAAFAILCAAQVSTRATSATAVDVVRASTATSLVALHAASMHRLGQELRSSMRWPSGVDAPLAASIRIGLPELILDPVAIVGAVEQSDSAVAARGYDATAPPALS
jgi:hypothetical protein